MNVREGVDKSIYEGQICVYDSVCMAAAPGIRARPIICLISEAFVSTASVRLALMAGAQHQHQQQTDN